MGVEHCADRRKRRRGRAAWLASPLILGCVGLHPACGQSQVPHHHDAQPHEVPDRPADPQGHIPEGSGERADRPLRGGGWTVAELAATAAWLQDRSPERRRTAIAALATLREDSLAAIDERVAQLHAEGHSAEAMGDAMRAFQAQPGAAATESWTRAAEGLLGDRRGDDARALIEAVLLLRALSSMDDVDAGLLLAEWVDLHGGLMLPLLDRAVASLGTPLLPALLRLRSHPDPSIKRWAQGHARSLGAPSPAQALTEDDPHRLAELVTAYSMPLDFAAMPYMVRLTAHPRLQVRAAARDAVERFGRNAIWQVREFYEEWTERPLDPALSIAEARTTLYAVIDAEDGRLVAQRKYVTVGLSALERGDVEAARKALDAALERWPEPAQVARLADAYAALADRSLAKGELSAAERDLQNALWLSEAPSEKIERLRAQLTFVRAEQDLTRGVADTYAYRSVLQTLPKHEGARRARASLARHRRGTRQAWTLGVLSTLALAGSAVFLLAFRRTLPRGEKPRKTANWHVRRRRT